MKILGTICARGGSKSVKNKNIRELIGKPLIAYTVEYFKKWGKADRIICSTDSKEIADIAKQYGAEIPFMRPAELATDNAAKLPVLQHALKYCEKQDGCRYDILVDLDPTAPLRKFNHIEEAFKLFIDSDANDLVSVCESYKNPYYNMLEVDEKGYAHLSKELSQSLVRRQDSPEVYDMNASIYIYHRDFLINTDKIISDKMIIYKMPEITSVDIDREMDFQFTEFLLKKRVFEFD